ncbi:MAG: O-antigen ligase family protein [Dehalococcoidia bacterium]|nr:O-antigen ligase family protein [Dehalococcoidia bacterium]
MSTQTDSPVNKGLLLAIKLGTLLVLLTPLVVTQSTLFPYVVGKATYSRALIEIVLACWVALALRQPAYRPLHSWLLWLFGIYLVGGLIAAVSGVSFQRSFWGDYRRMGGVFDLAHWVAFAVVLASVFKQQRDWRWLLNANLGISLVVALLGLTQHYRIPVFDSVFWYLRTTAGANLGRVDITFGNATYVGAYMLVNVFLALAFLAGSGRPSPQQVRHQTRTERRGRRSRERQAMPSIWPWRAFWTATALLDLWVLTLSGTRGAVVGLAAGLIVAGIGYLVWGRRPRMKVLVGTLIAVPILMAVALPLWRESLLFQNLARSNVTAGRFQSLLTLGSQDTSVSSRFSTAQAGLRAFAHAPVFGWGPENFAVAFDQYATTRETSLQTQLADQAHNKPVEELVTKGVVGFTIYLLLLGWMVWVLIHIVRREQEARSFAILLGAGVIAYMVQDLFLFDTPGTFLQFILLLGWVASREGQMAVQPAPARGISKAAPSSNPARAAKERNVLPGFILTPGMQWAASVAILLLAGASLYLFVYRPYRAAQLMPVESASVKEFLEKAQSSFQTFPPLATLSRQILFDTISENLPRIPKGQRASLLDKLEPEAKAALRSEPQNARLRIGLARVYQLSEDPSYIPLARSHVEAAEKLAPGLLGTLVAGIEQEEAEGNYAKALTMTFQYIGKDQARQQALNDLMNRLQRLLAGQIGRDEYLCRWTVNGSLTLEERAKIQCEKKPTS